MDARQPPEPAHRLIGRISAFRRMCLRVQAGEQLAGGADRVNRVVSPDGDFPDVLARAGQVPGQAPGCIT